MNAHLTFARMAALLLVFAPAAMFARTKPYGAPAMRWHRAVILVSYPAGGSPPVDGYPKVSTEKSGTVPAKAAGTVHLTLDLGNVRVLTDEHAQISYRALVEADSRDPGAEEFLRQFKIAARETASGVDISVKVPWHELRARFNSEIELHIPRSYNLEVNTGGGNVEVQDIDGRVTLLSNGGNISAGRIGNLAAGIADREAAGGKHAALKPAQGYSARIETQGGQISVGDVAGSLRAVTAGGHILAGNISGDASLRTGGGQILAERIAGSATLDSGGGNIQIESAGAGVTADSAGGGLVLRQAAAPLQAAATTGGLTAWLEPAAGNSTARTNARQSAQASQLSSGNGDLVLYLPRGLAATIDARIEEGEGHRIFADPSLPMQISEHGTPENSRAIHYAMRLNGGGEVLHLKAVAGNIVLHAGDSQPQATASAARAGYAQSGASPAAVQSLVGPQFQELSDADGFFAEVRLRILESWWGAVPVAPEELQKHLERSIAPVYPEVARKAGIEGDVLLRIYVSGSGQVTDIKLIDGPPILARAAIEAVQHWQYQPPRMDGHPTPVVSTLVVSFRLH